MAISSCPGFRTFSVLNQGFTYSISPLGDCALLIQFQNILDESVNKKVLLFLQQLKKSGASWIKDIVPAYTSLAVHYNPLAIVKEEGHQTIFETVVSQIKKIIDERDDQPEETQRVIRVPVCYEKRYAPDLEQLATEKELTVQQVIELHTAKSYRVYMIGFLPGFAYMGEVDERIAFPRKQQPANVAAGSVGIAGKQTGIYPLSSPGGWQIIGRTPLLLFDKAKQDPVLFNPGDEVIFYPISAHEFKSY
jgi:inhibitor of KinA